MNALTLHQPWAHAVAHLGKRIENRTWAPPASAMGAPLAIHAGLQRDAAGDQHLAALGHPPAFGAPRGMVVAVVFLVDVLRDAESAKWINQGQWWAGPIAWWFTAVAPLATAVPCRGRQRLWTLPPDVEARVQAQLEAIARGVEVTA